ncbi:MAG: DegT/DnrJ/EryC1/StrS family aminotransferase, partial [Spirochaetota bacterium]
AVGASFNGKKSCSFGDAGCLSFFPSKNLGAFGDGGMVLTDDFRTAEVIKMIKNHGTEKKYYHARLGFNGRLDALQAALLRVKLGCVDRFTENRRQNASYYNEKLKNYVSVPRVQEGFYHVFNQYSVMTEKRDQLMDYLGKKGVATAVYYPVPLHLQEVFGHLGYKKGDFPVSERASERILSLPVFPELKDEEREYVCDSIVSFFNNSGGY